MKRFEGLIWVLALAWAIAALVPARFWYDAHDTRVDDFYEGDPFELLYSGGAVRDFIGSYAVIIRNTDTRAIVGEDRSARFPYRADAVRPMPLTITWWAPGDARAHALPPGSYQMQTCWTIHDAFWGLVPAKTTCSESNIFRVHQRQRERLQPSPVFRWPGTLGALY
ncbi:MAG: hypothetical protein AAGP08_03450 [Pseudomonadota bacterium]